MRLLHASPRAQSPAPRRFERWKSSTSWNRPGAEYTPEPPSIWIFRAILILASRSEPWSLKKAGRTYRQEQELLPTRFLRLSISRQSTKPAQCYKRSKSPKVRNPDSPVWGPAVWHRWKDLNRPFSQRLRRDNESARKSDSGGSRGGRGDPPSQQ